MKMKKIIAGLIITIALLTAFSTGTIYIFPEKVMEITSDSQRGKAKLELKSVKAGDIHYKYLEGGEGEPLLLVHGFGASKDSWTQIARYLTPHFKVIAPDLAGCGESSRNFSIDYTISAQSDRLHEFVKALELESFHLGGNSMGGAISGAYASKHSNMLKSLWLIAPGNIYSAKESDFIRLLKKGENPLITRNAREFKALLDLVYYKKPYVPSPFLKVFVRKAIANKPMNAKVFADLMGEKLVLEETVQGLSIPTLVLWGDRDRVLDVSGADILCRTMANATCVIMQDTGHVPMIEKPAEASKSFLKFHSL